jgi:hypothetical protein
MDAIGFDIDTTVITNRVRVNVTKVQRRAIGTLARRLPVQARRDIQQEYNLKAARINAGLSARTTADGVVLRGKARGVNAIEFGARWRRTQPGVSVQIKKRQTKVLPGTFIATGRGGNTLVLKRTGKARLPLEAVYGPSIGQMLKHGDRPQRLADYARGIVAAEIARLTR